MKEKLDNLVKKYETEDFIKSDPVQFPHRFKTVEDIEVSALIASLFAYGKRELFIKKLDILFKLMRNKPYEFLLNYDENSKILDGFYYRFQTANDIKAFISALSKLYKSKNGLSKLFFKGYKEGGNLRAAQEYFARWIYENINCKPTLGFCNLISNSKTSANKRINMFLRWMVRKGSVDLGVWDFVSESELYIPLDVHVAKVSRDLGLLKRNSNDFKAVVELTEKLKEFDPNDPVKYDFALFAADVE